MKHCPHCGKDISKKPAIATICEHLGSNGPTSVKDLAEVCGVSTSRVRQLLIRLEDYADEYPRLESIGAGRSTLWQIAETQTSKAEFYEEQARKELARKAEAARVQAIRDRNHETIDTDFPITEAQSEPGNRMWFCDRLAGVEPYELVRLNIKRHGQSFWVQLLERDGDRTLLEFLSETEAAGFLKSNQSNSVTE